MQNVEQAINEVCLRYKRSIYVEKQKLCAEKQKHMCRKQKHMRKKTEVYVQKNRSICVEK